jgi:hypothetical protein
MRRGEANAPSITLLPPAMPSPASDEDVDVDPYPVVIVL